MEYDVKRWETPISDDGDIYNRMNLFTKDNRLIFWVEDVHKNLFYEFIFFEVAGYMIFTEDMQPSKGHLNNYEKYKAIGNTYIVENSDFKKSIDGAALFLHCVNLKTKEEGCKSYFIDTRDKCVEVVTAYDTMINTYTETEFEKTQIYLTYYAR